MQLTDYLTLDIRQQTPSINNVSLVMQLTDYLTLDINKAHQPINDFFDHAIDE